MYSSVVHSIIAQLQFLKSSSFNLHPIHHVLKFFTFWMLRWQPVFLIYFLLKNFLKLQNVMIIRLLLNNNLNSFHCFFIILFVLQSLGLTIIGLSIFWINWYSLVAVGYALFYIEQLKVGIRSVCVVYWTWFVHCYLNGNCI